MVLPITVVVPTYNVMTMLPRHVAAMRAWMPHVEKVVVVDSYSQDGTSDYLSANLTGHNVEILRHPPGLYESWNFGVSHADTPFVYFSTVGDTISRDGLTALCQTAVSLDCDVVISPPRLMTDRGKLAEQSWPIHQIISLYGIRSPLLLSEEVATYISTRYLPASILGSSASNLYRTDCLRKLPFPCEFGQIGDVAWGALYATQVSFGVYPETISDFVHHKRQRPWDSVTYGKRSCMLFELASDQVLARRQSEKPANTAERHMPETDVLLRHWIQASIKRRMLDLDLREERSSGAYWMLNPRAWRLRWARNRALAAERPLERQLDDMIRPAIEDSLPTSGQAAV
ncbi:glycosyltransferase family 2 protein [Hoeflea poritis]|uniref:Glycosyltransferase n=1 Tax=Hoeflea poritis TaxID=2993659 RepID=A0ABT4VS55_9HYPH|nr:glycosyltransferase family 2 protein [Hoeflea poritis]MDA4847548.1 glycosyltransferase [Hoeflea poritis]